ncbi:hypothetical protein VTK56DRAFT_3060 [Thermocarpiscus australiensis]
MTRLTGAPLASVWYSLSPGDRYRIAGQVGKYVAEWRTSLPPTLDMHLPRGCAPSYPAILLREDGAVSPSFPTTATPRMTMDTLTSLLLLDADDGGGSGPGRPRAARQVHAEERRHIRLHAQRPQRRRHTGRRRRQRLGHPRLRRGVVLASWFEVASLESSRPGRRNNAEVDDEWKQLLLLHMPDAEDASHILAWYALWSQLRLPGEQRDGLLVGTLRKVLRGMRLREEKVDYACRAFEAMTMTR